MAKEQWALALLTAHFDCAQQKFFQGEYGRRRRSPAVALALCLTLGAFGAHEFYMGRLVSATLRLLFCWTLIPLLLALIEASFLTQRVYAYNTRMAHTLAEIVDETFAAAREEANWQVGAARTLAPQPPTRWSQDTPPTTPLAEERLAPDLTPSLTPPSPSPTGRGEPSAQADFPRTSQESGPAGAVEPAPAVSRPLGASRREWARLSPSLDALLDDLVALADEAEAQRASQPTAPTSQTSTGVDAPIAPIEVAGSGVETLPAHAATPVVVYAKMMAPDEPLAAIMGAEPAHVAAPAPRIQRIIVRKVALLDGQRIAEARATREVVLSGADDREAAARIEAATDEAREEAERLLADLVTPEALTQARVS